MRRADPSTVPTASHSLDSAELAEGSPRGRLNSDSESAAEIKGCPVPGSPAQRCRLRSRCRHTAESCCAGPGPVLSPGPVFRPVPLASLLQSGSRSSSPSPLSRQEGGEGAKPFFLSSSAVVSVHLKCGWFHRGTELFILINFVLKEPRVASGCLTEQCS